MFTIKLYFNADSYNVISAPHYNIRTFNTDEGFVTEITVYKDMTTQDGTIYRVAKNISVPHWNYAFIENSSGKTIDHIKH